MLNIDTLREEAAQKLLAKTGNLLLARVLGKFCVADEYARRIDKLYDDKISISDGTPSSFLHLNNIVHAKPLFSEYSLMPLRSAVEISGRIGDEAITYLVGDATIDVREYADAFVEFAKKIGYLRTSPLLNECVVGDLAFFGLEYLYNCDQAHRQNFKQLYSEVCFHYSPWVLACDAIRDTTFPPDSSSGANSKDRGQNSRTTQVGRPRKKLAEPEMMALSLRSQRMSHKAILHAVQKDHPTFTQANLKKLFDREDRREKRRKNDTAK